MCRNAPGMFGMYGMCPGMCGMCGMCDIPHIPRIPICIVVLLAVNTGDCEYEKKGPGLFFFYLLSPDDFIHC